ncbi:MAG: protein translocase subunit SecD [Clostridiales bacterium]|nr:protein translocase subunit SecD [Clostridiales bacterium]
MRRVNKSAFYITALLIVVFTVLSFVGISTQYGDIKKVYIKGVEDIRWGIDIRGGVDVTFTPPEGVKATNEQMDSVKEVIVQRLVGLNITDHEVYVDYNKDRLIVRFPWKAGDESFDPEAAVNEIGETAMLTFRESYITDPETGLWSGVTEENIILEGSDVENAQPGYDEQQGEFMVQLKLTSEGRDKFSEATKRLATTKDSISIWMDKTMISNATVQTHISEGSAVISGNFTAESAKALADKINAGALPFELVTANFSTISPTLGLGARDAMALSGAIAFIVIAIFITYNYRLPGVVAVIALMGQVAGSIAAITGFFGFLDSFTLTIPGIAGIVMAVGMGVDANILTAERIREELYRGKTLNGAIESGFKRGFTAIFDGNLTIIFVAIILMGAFGPPDSLFAKLLSPVFFMFGPSTAGAIYSFGYTLLVGVVFNFVMGVTCSRIMVMALSKTKTFSNKWLYGGENNA